MIVNMIFDKTRYLALMPVNKISHNSGMAQLPLALSGKLFTTMKKALFHGHLRVFGEKMNTSVYRLSHATTSTYLRPTSPVGHLEQFVLPTEPCHHNFVPLAYHSSWTFGTVCPAG
jgi:hypothetical protein